MSDDRPMDVQVASLWAEVESLCERQKAQEIRLRVAEELLDTYVETSLWRRLLFVIDGWPAHGLADRPAWRPWRRWWTS